MKHIYTDSKAREKLLKGIDTVADIVKATLGPCGSNVILKTPYNAPTIVNDGVSIAREIVLEDPTENAGAVLMTSAASATNSAVGDGTTTTCILTQGLIKDGFKAIEKDGANPILLREELKKCAEDFVYPELDKQVESCDTIEKLQKVATISVGGNEEYGKLIGDALFKVGTEGIVNLENNSFPETTLSMIDGYKIERGYMSPYAINDTEKYVVDYENCLVLCCYHKIIKREHVETLFNYAYESQKPILLIVEDMDESIFGGLQVNLMKRVFKICPVKSPGFGFNVRDYMNDIAKMTGCMVYAEDTRDMSTFTPDDFGFAARVTANRECTCIIRGDEDSREDLDEYIKSLRNQLAATENEHLKDSLKERISKLTVGVATISVGAKSQTEQNELKLRIEDAINAARAALRGGIVSGGGCALAAVSTKISNLNTDFSSREQKLAYKIMEDVLLMPEDQIVENSGGSADGLKRDLIGNEEMSLYNFGFNGITRHYEDLKAVGIIDPALVVKSAVENAVSIASTVLTTQATIIAEDKGE
jgi:chaperonin GroEL